MSEITPGVALVVGINDYGDGIKPLRSAVNDARALATALERDHKYRTTLLLDAAAAAPAVLDVLAQQIPAALTEDTPFLFYFAGHGVARGDEDDGPQGYLLAQDARLADPVSWLAMTALREALEALPCRHLLVVLDCCFAGSFRWASTRAGAWDSGPLFDSQFERFLRGRAWQALTSASHDEEAQDVAPGRGNTRDQDEGQDHSPFARALLRGLSGAADSSRGGHQPDGVITATELYQYTFEELVPADGSSRQTPGIWPLRPDNTGQFIFRNPACEKNTRPDPPLDDANNPWLGLAAYAHGDAPLFFGRERVTRALLDRVDDPQTPRFVAIVGASGTGKSSVAKAGVLPRLDEQGWSIVHAPRIGDDPVGPLHQAAGGLASVRGQKLLFIDQFEELYTQCRDPERRTAYLERLMLLLDEDDTLTILLTLRTDFEPQPASHPLLVDVWEAGRVVVPAFSAEELRECIEGPAQVRALYFEPPALVGTLVDEVMAMPGALPMLSFALSQMYQRARQRRRDTGAADRALTQADYEATGGVVGALHRRATDLYEAGDAATQATIRRVFLRMLSQDGARLARRRVSREELSFADPDEQARVDDVLDQYIEARLLVTDAGDVEPAHDTLIIAWDRLIQWLSDAGPQNLTRATWRAARDWRDSDRDAGLTWHDDPRLPQALTQTGEFNALERSFVAASEALRVARRRRLIVGGATVVSVIAAAAVVALWQWRVALTQQRLAEDRLARAQSGTLLAHAQAQSDPVLKAVLIAEIAQRGLPVPARAAQVAYEANAALGSSVVFVPGGDQRTLDIRLSDVGVTTAYRLLQGDNEFDTFAWEPYRFHKQRDALPVSHARYTRNGRSVFARFRDGTFGYWPRPNGSDVLLPFDRSLQDLASDQTGWRIATAGNGAARVSDIAVANGGLNAYDVPGDDVMRVALNASGDVLATGTHTGQVTLIDLPTRTNRWSFSLSGPVDHLALDRSGETLVAAGKDGVLVTRKGDGTQMSTGRCASRPADVAISPDGQVIAAVCDGSAWLWRADNLSHGRALSPGGVNGIRFVSWPGAMAQDGLWLAGLRGSEDTALWPVVTAQVAAVGDEREAQAPPLVAAGHPTTYFDPQTRDIVVSTNVDHDVRVQVPEDEDDGVVTFTVEVPETSRTYRAGVETQSGLPPTQFLVYRNATRTHVFAVATEGNFWSAALFDLTAEPSDDAVQTLKGMLMHDAALTPDGRYLIIVSDVMNPNFIAADPKVYRTDALDMPPRTLPGQTWIRDVAVGPEGKRIATTDCRGQTFVWTVGSWTDPIVLDSSVPGVSWLCGPSLGYDQKPVQPAAAFTADGGSIVTLRDGQPVATWTIDYAALSATLLRRTYACLTVAQREQFLDEAPDQAAAAYAACRAGLGLGP